jgi:hypothetical protein
MCSDPEAGSFLRRIDFVYNSALGLRVIKKKREEIRLDCRMRSARKQGFSADPFH